MAEDAGLHAEPLRSGHWRITTAGGRWVTNLSGTSSDRRAVLPVRSAIRRAVRAA